MPASGPRREVVRAWDLMPVTVDALVLMSMRRALMRGVALEMLSQSATLSGSTFGARPFKRPVATLASWEVMRPWISRLDISRDVSATYPAASDRPMAAWTARIVLPMEGRAATTYRSEEHTSELQSRGHLV